MNKQEIIVKKICDHCNKQYTLNLGQNIVGYCYNFGICPYCKKRNDVWITVKLKENIKEQPEGKRTCECGKTVFLGKKNENIEELPEENIKCLTFDKEAQNNLPQHIKDKMKEDREKAEKERSCADCYFSGNGKHGCNRLMNYSEGKIDESKGVECAYNNYVHYIKYSDFNDHKLMVFE